MKRQRLVNIVLFIYLLITTSCLANLYLAWSVGPMAGMANGFMVLWWFGFVCILTIVVWIVFYSMNAGLRLYAVSIAMLCVWVAILMINVS